MSLQTDLHQAVAQVTADSALLHTIVHGTAAQTVTTQGGALATVAKLLADADARINLAADGLLAQSQAAAQDALTSAELAASEADRAQASADQGVADTTAVLNQVQFSGNQILVDAEAVLQQVIARLLAVGLPDSLIGARGMLLKVKVDESGYELVHTAALPRFYGFALSSDGSELLLTEGRDANFNAQDFLAWTLAEGVTFALHQNALEVQL
jgi:multidrug efflux pump subunit AcrA (membrane-fusion protein)